MKTVRYADIREDIKIGDVLLFEGIGTISNVIKYFTKSRYSHAGVAWRSDEWDMNLLWESTSIGTVPDVNDGTLKKGVQTVSLSQKMATYDGAVILRQLNKPFTPEMISEMVQFRTEIKDRPYEESVFNLAHAVFDRLSDTDEDLSSMFCSELVAELYQRVGLLPEQLASSEYVPSDFSIKRMTDLLNGYSLGEEIVIIP